MSTRDEFRSSGFFAIRTPLLPFAAWEELAAGARAPRCTSDEELPAALQEDCELIRARLRDWLQDAAVRDALFVASPSLDQDMRHWLEAPASEKGLKAERPIVKYFGRMACRSTPFGLFSGCSTGVVSAETRLQLAERVRYERHTRPDMDFLAGLVDGLNRDPELRRELRYRPNSSLYRIGDRAQHVEARLAGRQRNYYLVTVTLDEALVATLERAAQGATMEELAAVLMGPEIQQDEALTYLHQLIDGQVLVPELAPSVTGPESLDDLLDQLHGKRPAEVAHDRLLQLRAALADVDSGGLGARPARYRGIAAALGGLPVDTNMARLFQVDMIKPAAAMELGEAVVEDVLFGVQVLHDLFGSTGKDGLEDFRNAFRDRYEDREVPLTEVLDEEVGIGFRSALAPGNETSPLLAGIQFPRRPVDRTVPVTATTQLVERRLVETLAAGLDEMELTSDDIAGAIRPQTRHLPDAFEVMCRILPSAEGSDARPNVMVDWMSGPSGARLLGRFCHADAELRRQVVQHLTDEEALQPESTFFEIVHLPEGRIGNVIARPVLRRYELAYLGRSGAERDRQLSLGDLFVSMQGERIVLRSRSLGREVIPRLTTAHNTERRTVGVYRFLAALQGQGVSPWLTWSWGASEHLPFLPRVRCGRAVLAVRTWNAVKKDIRFFSDGDSVRRFQRVQTWRRERGLPRHVGLVDGDNVLPVDFDNCASVDAFVDLVAKRTQLQLREMLPDPSRLAVTGPEGRFCHEIIVPFVRKSRRENVQSTPAWVTASASGNGSSGAPFVARQRPPGSDWLYVKVYCGPATADRVLLQVIAPLVDEFVPNEDVKSWFFVRYADPATHLRVRFQGESTTLVAHVLPAFEARLRPHLESGLVWRMQVDTYERELRRYGGPWGMELCESLFHADSDAVLDIVRGLDGDATAEMRWHLALRGVDRILEDFELDLPRKFALMHESAKFAALEFGLAGAYKERVLDKYRKERQSIERVLTGFGDAFRSRSERWRPIATRLGQLSADGKLPIPVHEIVRSLVHMHTNRMLRASNRAQETILYQFLDRHYDSQLARLGNKGKQRDAIRFDAGDVSAVAE